MKSFSAILNHRILLSLSVLLLSLHSFDADAQCYLAPSYCTNITATNNACYNMGFQNVTLNTVANPNQINNTTTSNCGGASAIYNNYTSMVLNAAAGAVVRDSIKVGSSNSTTFRIYIDYNQDGVFAITSPELVYTSPTTAANNWVSGTFTIPAGTPSGIYRIRIAGDYSTAPGPCGPLTYSAEIEDYTLLVPSSTADMASGTINPSYFVSGSNTVGITFSNISSVTITSADIGYQLGSNSPVLQSLTGLSIPPGGSYSATFTTPLSISGVGGTFNIRAWSTNPNSLGSVTPANDTLCRSFTTYCSGPLNGSYTIDPLGSGTNNFTTFAKADSALISCGVSGPVVFNVAAGTFNEQVYVPAIAGVSATNTITFDGGTGNASTRIISYAATVQALSYTVRIDNSQWIRFRNLTIRGTGTSYAWPMHIYGNSSSNNQVRNCIIDFGAGTGATGTSDNFTPVVINSSPSTISNNSTVSNIDIDSNTITGGNNGIYFYGQQNNNINFRNNTISGAYTYGIYFYYLYGFRCDFNTISMRQTGSSSSVGIYVNFCPSGGTFQNEIIGNIITDAGQYGMNIYYLQGSTIAHVKVVNNMIGGAYRNTDPAGIYFNNYCQNIDIWFNSINLDFASTGSQSAALKMVSSCSSFDLRNNNLVVSNANASAYTFYCDASSSFNTLDFNDYFKAGNPLKLMNILGVDYAISNFKGALGFNSNSISVDPVYTSARNLKTNRRCSKGITISGITTDFEGNTRNTPPDIGCDENIVSYTTDLSVVSITNPTIPMATGSQNIKVVIRNNGTIPIYSATVVYQVNGGSTQSIYWTGTLNACDTQTVNFSATSGPGSSSQQFAFLPGNNYILKAYTTLPNGSFDMNPSNDSLTIGPLCTGLAGSFTIDASLPATSTNFTSFVNAVNGLLCGGISGPVYFIVDSGIYNGQVDITNIPGSSAINTITFDGGTGNAASRIIIYNASASNALHTIRVNNANYISFRNLTIRNTSVSYGWPLHILGNSSNIKVKNCLIDFVGGNGVNGTSDNYVSVVVNNYAASSCPTCGQWTGSNLEIDSNRIVGGNTCVDIYGNGSNTGIFFRNNIMDSAYTYGMYALSLSAPKINSNILDMRVNGSTSSYGFYFSSVSGSATDYFDFRKNRIYDAGYMGVYLGSSSGVAGSFSNMINNSIGGGFRNASPYGIYFTSSNYWNVWFNSINIDNASSGSTSSAYFSGTSNIDCRDNNFAVTSTSAGSGMLPFISASGTTFINLNANNYYKAGTPATLIQVNGTNYSPSTYNTLSAGGTNSISNYPSFTTYKNLRPTIATNNGIQLTGIATDIYDSVRNNPPDVGAFEISGGITTDLGIIRMYSPDTFLTSGLRDVIITVKNWGNTPITYFNLRHSVNGTNLQDSTFSGFTLNTGDTLKITMTGLKKVNLTAGVMSTFKVYIHQPNGSLDNNGVNDSIIIGPKVPALSGIYTINPFGSGSTNFVNFRLAVAALALAGVSGPVTFNVSSATYNEQVNVPFINGASITNTITFDGGTGNAATRIIDTAANTTSSYWTVMLNNSPYVTFRNLTINASGSTYGVAVQIGGGSHFSKFKNCVIQIGSSGAASTSSYFIPILISSTTTITSPTSGTTQVNYLEIDSNTINYGYYGIYSWGYTGTPYCNNNKFRYNTLSNQYYYGIYLYYYDGFTFSSNTVNMRTTGGSSSYATYFYFCYTSGTNLNTITYNKIMNAGSCGIYSYYGGSSGPRSIIANNMIGGGFKYNGSYGMYIGYLTNYDIFNNTVNLDYTQTGDSYAALYLTGGTSIDVRNNIFANTAQTGNVGMPVYVASMPSGLFRLDYNNYYKTSTSTSNLIYLAGTYYTNSSFVNGGGYNSFSINRNPAFSSSLDLHISDACMRGTAITGITTDIDGQTRNNPPNMGADEVSGTNNDLGTVSISPFVAGLQNVKVLIKNYGVNNITSATIAYAVNGGLPKIVAWTGLLAACDTTTITFSGVNQYNFAMGTSYSIVAYTSSPNGTIDPHTSNDTTTYGPSCVMLSGNFTINPSGSGTNNFTSFTAAANALNCGGVNGPVSIKVAAGTYNEQITLNNIPGASSINTVTIDGDTAATRIITFAPTVSTEHHTIRLNGAQYVSIRNLTVQTTGANFGSCVHLMGSSNYTKIKNCNLFVSGNGASSTSNYYIGLLLNNYNDAYSVTSGGTQVNNIEIDSNHIVGGYYGVMHYGYTSTPYSNNFYYRQNVIDSSYYYGTYFYYTDGIVFNNNTINMRINGSTSSSGLYVYFCFAQGSNIHSINSNKVTNAGQYGMYLYYAYNGTSTYRSRLSNNMIGGGFRNASSIGIYCYNLNYWDLFNNSVNLDYPVTTNGYAAMSVSQGSQHDIRNNILVYSASTGAGVPLSVASTGILTALDYNDYYNAASSNLLVLGATSYTNSNFINGGGYNLYSKNQNPGFASNMDLHIGSGCIRGTQLTGITIDMFGTTRGNPPSMGAHEYTGSLNNDIGVSFLISPSMPFNAGTQDVKVRISNFGSNTVTSATVKYTVNGGTPKSFTWTGTLNPCDTTSITFTGTNQFNFVLGNSYTLKAYTESPNGISDANKNNDTLIINVCPAMSGNYTINPSGSGTTNFTTFTAAANILNCGGINGPVSFTVSSSTYNEQIQLNAIAGASATNTITFTGTNSSTCIITFAPSVSTAAYTIRLNNAPYVSFRNLTIQSSGSTYGNPVHIFGNCNYSKFKNCTINFTGTAQSSTSSYFIPLIINGNADITNMYNGSYVTGLEIDSNRIQYGYYGIFMYGVTSTPYANNNYFRNNNIDSAYYYGVYAYYEDGFKFKNNNLNMRINGNPSSYGLYQYFCYTSGSNFHEITANKIINAGNYGMYIYFSTNQSTARGKFINNSIGGGFRSGSAYAVYMAYSDYWDIWNNSMNLDYPQTSNTYSAFYCNYTNLDIRNNHFIYSATSGTGLPFYSSSTVTTLNYNNYYNASSSNLLYLNAVTYTTGNYLGGGGSNANSRNVNPSFASAISLQTGGCMKGVAIAGVTNDIIGLNRNNPPDIGAYESVSNDAGVVAILSPSSPITPGYQNVVVQIKNFGSNTISSLNVTYNVNGTGPVTQSLSSISLVPCSTQTITFTGAQQYNFPSGGANIVAYSASPNSSLDSNRTNDTAKVFMCGPMSGVFTINPTGSGAGNFTSFNAAINAMNCAGITGPVVFNVAAGTYNEQVDVLPISGASAINTVTFDGGNGNASTRLLTYSSTNNTARHTWRFNGCKYVTVKNITIQTTGINYGWGVHFYTGADSNAVKKCIIDINGSAAPTSTNNSFIGVVASSSTSSEYSNITLNYEQIDSNIINNGYYGIMFYGNSSSLSPNIMMRKNTMNNPYYYGVYLYYLDGFRLNNNWIVMRNGINGNINSYGAYIYYCSASSTNLNEVNGNKITDAGNYGMYMYSSSASSSVRGRFWNNMIGGGFQNTTCYGVYFYSNNNWDIYNNSVNMDAATTNQQYAAFYLGSGTGNNVKNNIFAYTAVSGTGLPYYASTTTSYTSALTFDYNNFYKSGNLASAALIYSGGTYLGTTFVGGGGSNTHSLNLNPYFAGIRDLHTYDGCYRGDSVGVTMDVDWNTRASYPSIGASEVPSVSNDIGVKAILNPSVPISPGLQNIQVLIKNYGTNMVVGANVKYSVNGATPVNLSFADTIQSCTTLTKTFTGGLQYNFIAGNIYTIKVYTENPNGTADSYNGNDTLIIGPICVGLAGNFTINPSGSGTTNYTSFTNAINALLCSGVTGPVTFTVSAGTYNEQINIPSISGASVNNTITFDGGNGNTSTRILVNSVTTTNTPHTLRFTSAAFIQFRNLTIRNTNTTYAWPVHLYGSCNNLKIKNCLIEITGSGATTASTNFIPVVMSGSASTVYSNAQQDSIEIDSNIINGGYANIWDYNNAGTANRFRGNTLNQGNYYGIYVYYATEVKIKNNIINMWQGGINTSSAIYIYNCNPGTNMVHEISGNKLFDMGQYGIWCYFTSGSSTNPAQIINNMIGGGFRNTTSHSGIEIDYGNYHNIWFNTVNSDTATSNNSGAINLTNSSSVNVRNNILLVSSVNSQELPFYAATSSNISVLDYNNYYKAGNPSTLLFAGSSYGPSNYAGGGGYNNNSLNRDPLIVSKRNLHIGNRCLLGISIASVTTDIEGNIRNNPPVMGASENTTAFTNDIGVAGIVSPSVPLTPGYQNIVVVLANYGSNLVTSANVSYSVNGGAPVTMTIYDSIQPCDTSLVTFSLGYQYNFIAGNSYTIKAYGSLPNGSPDNNHANDTTIVGPICTGMSGNYTINPSGSGTNNFTSFNAAVSGLQCAGVSGPVNFIVSNGTYNEQVSISAINGVNDTTRVTFTGTSQGGTILNYVASVPTASHTLQLNNSPYVNFYNMTIQASGSTYGSAIHILGASNFVKIKYCALRISGSGATSTNSYFIPVMINNTSDITNPSNGTMVNNLEIDSNRINSGYYSVFIYGRSSTPYSNNNKFRKNSIDSAYQYGLYAYYEDGIKFDNNSLNMRITGLPGSYGIYMTNCYNSGTNFFDVSANKIINAAQYGVYMWFCSNSASYRGRFVNNMIGGGFRSSSSIGVYMQYSDYWDIFNNSINLDYPTVSNTYSGFSTNYSNLDIRNNIFDYTATSGSGLPFYASSTVTSLNYNNYYNASSTNLLYVNLNTYTSSTFISGGGYNANSFNATSPFINSTNLHYSTSVSLKGVSIASVTNDIDGEIRSLTPDIGADEYYASMDIGVLAIDSPTTVTTCGNVRNIVVRLKNYGNQSVSLATINLNVNGVYSGSYTWTGTLGLGAVSGPVTIGTFNFFNGGSYIISANTTSPNGGSDVNTSNDSAYQSFYMIPSVTPSISITTPNTSLCTGMLATYTATYANGGPSPIFQWRKNGITVGTNDSFYTNNSPANNDSIVCLLVSTATCASPATVVSNFIKMNVGTTLVPSISISANNSNVCPGTSVLFSSLSVNGGTSPHYQWKMNGVNVGSDTNIYLISSPVNNDSVRCILTSSLSCASKPRDTSNFVKITVNPFLTPAISITAMSTSICAGVTDSFTSVATNGGPTPVYQWKKNSGINIGTNSNILATSALANNDSIYLVMTSNATCANPAIVTSNKIGITVIPSVLPSASVTASQNPICPGDVVTFRLTGNNGGTSPLKRWMKNGTNVLNGTDSFTTSLLTSNDTIYVIYTSNATCAIPSVITSNQVVMSVNPVVTPTVMMSASSTNICAGNSVMFTASPINGGPAPHFTWRKNGINVGNDSTNFTTTILSNSDSVQVILTGSAMCATKLRDTSTYIKITVNNPGTPTILVNTSSTNVCQGVPVIFTASSSNGGITPHYQWKKNGLNIGSDTIAYSSTSLATGDSIYVILTSSNACAIPPVVTSNKIVMTINPSVTASVSISANQNNICSGIPITFTASIVNGGSAPLYQWKVNGNNVGANNGTFISSTLKDNDTINLQMTSSVTCALPAVANSNKIRMALIPSVTPRVNVTPSATNVCGGTYVVFTALDSNSGTQPHHVWLLNGLTSGGDSSTFTIQVNYGDVIKGILYSNANCATKNWDTANSGIVIKASPKKPVIIRSLDTLISTTSNSYQWFLNNNSISGATSKKFKLTQNGTYKVSVDSFGCSNTSDPFTVNNVGIAPAITTSFISIAPNPTQSEVLIDAKFETEEETIISLYDMTGKLLKQIEDGTISNIRSEKLNLEEFRSGMYFIQIQHGHSMSTRKIVKAD